MVNIKKAQQLRLQGCTYKQIAAQLKCSIDWCKKNLKDVQAAQKDEDQQTSDIAKLLRFARTTITLKDGTIQPARINMSSGEIKPYKYKDYYSYKSIKVSGKMNDSSIPFWVLDERYFNISPSCSLSSLKRVVNYNRPYKGNSIKEFLDSYTILDEAKDDIFNLDNIITGVSNLGVSNPVSPKLLFHLLQNLDSIDFNSIKDATEYSDRFCYELVSRLTVLENALQSEFIEPVNTNNM